jgi:hypothetical protein
MSSRRIVPLALAVTALAGSARAEDADEKARALFKEGRALAAAGRYAEACPKFEDSRRVADGPGTTFNLADCYEHVGRLSRAWVLFSDVVQTTHDLGERDREDAARRRANALDARLSHFSLRVAEPLDDFVVRANGEVVPREAWASPIAVDRGTATVDAEAPGRKPWHVEVTVPDTPSTIVVEIPALQRAPRAAKSGVAPAPRAAGETPSGRGASADSTPPSPDGASSATEGADEHRSSVFERLGPPTVQWTLLGAAGAGLFTAGISMVIYENKNTRAKTICPSGVGCSAQDIASHQALVDGASTARGVGWVGVGVTAASLLTGVVLYFTAPRSAKSREASAPWLVRAAASGRDGSVFVEHAF